LPTFSFKNVFASATALARLIVAFGFGGGFSSRMKIVFSCGVASALFALAGFFGFFTTATAGGLFFIAAVLFPAAFFFARFAAIEGESSRSESAHASMDR
jgi:hypothetical protein